MHNEKLKPLLFVSSEAKGSIYTLKTVISWTLLPPSWRIVIISSKQIQKRNHNGCIRIRIRIYLLTRSNLLWDILRLTSSRRAALGLYVIHTLWRGRGANQPPCALLHRCSLRYALRHRKRHVSGIPSRFDTFIQVVLVWYVIIIMSWWICCFVICSKQT